MKHACRWPGCTVQVSAFFWGCPQHWMSLPRKKRQLLLDAAHRAPPAERVRAIREARAAIEQWITSYQASQRGQDRARSRPPAQPAPRPAAAILSPNPKGAP